MCARRRKRALIFSKGAVGLAAAHRASTLLGLLGQLLGNPAQSKRIAPKRYAERIFSRFSLPSGLPIPILPSSQSILTRNHLRTQIEFNWSAPRRGARSPSTSICAAWRAFERVPLRRGHMGAAAPVTPNRGRLVCCSGHHLQFGRAFFVASSLRKSWHVHGFSGASVSAPCRARTGRLSDR
jgi:hypothetical protein